MNRNDILWFLAEVKITKEKKLHIEHVICRLYDVLDGIEYIYKNKTILNNNRLIAIIKEDGDTRIYRQDKQESIGFSECIFKCANLESDYDNCEELFPYCDEYVEHEQGYGVIHYKYE